MKRALSIIQNVIRLAWTVIIILGLLYWGGLDPDAVLRRIHLVMGIVLVVSLWALAGVAARARVQPALVGLMVAWSLVMAALGMWQKNILPGTVHWTIQILHLLVGIGALAQAEMIGGRIKTALEASIKVSKHPVRRVRVSR